jgi:putative ABC transport system substrate-binding protein
MRRAVVGAVALLAVSLAACGDDGKPDRTIAFLRASPINQASQDAFLAEVADAGWKVGDNLTVLDPDVDEFYADPGAAEKAVRGWVGHDVDVIVALSTTSAVAATTAAPDVPVLTMANDPVASGLLKDPRAPEGDVTGIAFRVPPDRTLDVATRLVPGTTAIGLLWPSDDVGAASVRDGFLRAASGAKVDVVSAPFRSGDDVAAAVQKLADAHVQSVVLVNAPTTVRAFDAIAAATTAARLPVVANTNSCMFAVAILAPDNVDVYRQIARQAVRLFEGKDVHDIPLEEPGTFHLVVNRDAASTIGIEVPGDLVRQAAQAGD